MVPRACPGAQGLGDVRDEAMLSCVARRRTDFRDADQGDQALGPAPRSARISPRRFPARRVVEPCPCGVSSVHEQTFLLLLFPARAREAPPSMEWPCSLLRARIYLLASFTACSRCCSTV